MDDITVDHNYKLPAEFDIDSAIKIVRNIFRNENLQFNDINVVFVSDEYLKDLHTKYLHKTHKTDVITFDLSEEGQHISGEIYISVERAEDQATDYGISIADELYRYVIHGTLHLCGCDDLCESDRRNMKLKEDEYLLILSKFN